MSETNSMLRDDSDVPELSSSFFVEIKELMDLMNPSTFEDDQTNNQSNSPSGTQSTLVQSNNQSNNASINRIIQILDRYQEQCELIDPHLQSIVDRLFQWIETDIDTIYQSINQTNNQSIKQSRLPLRTHRACAVLYSLSKMRGPKKVKTFFPAKVTNLEPVLRALVDELRVDVVNQAIENANNQPTEQLNNQSINQPINQASSTSSNWQTRYALLLWLSIIVLIPFDLTSVDSHTFDESIKHIYQPNNQTNNQSDIQTMDLIETLISIGKQTVNQSINQSIGCMMLGKLFSRSDLINRRKNQSNGYSINQSTNYLGEFFVWGIMEIQSIFQAINNSTSQSNNQTINQSIIQTTSLIGILRSFVEIVKYGQRDSLVPHLSTLKVLIDQSKNQSTSLSLDPSINLPVSLSTNQSVVIRQLYMKLVQRLGLIYQKPRAANQSINKSVTQANNRSLVDNLNVLGKQSTKPSNNQSVQLNQPINQSINQTINPSDLPAPELEPIIDCLIDGLVDRSTIVRWSAAKGIGRLIDRLIECDVDCLVEWLFDCLFDYRTINRLFYDQPANQSINQSVNQSTKSINQSASQSNKQLISQLNDQSWHGGLLAIAELSRRGIISPTRLMNQSNNQSNNQSHPPISQLEQAIRLIQIGLIFEINQSSNQSIGSNVRDAACYAFWAICRTYQSIDQSINQSIKDTYQLIAQSIIRTGDRSTKQSISLFKRTNISNNQSDNQSMDQSTSQSINQSISCALITTALFDREINVRRAASAALQEQVGRQGRAANQSNNRSINQSVSQSNQAGSQSIAHGIELITIADYFSINQTKNCYLSLAVIISRLNNLSVNQSNHQLNNQSINQSINPYIDCLIDRLIDMIDHSDHEIRTLAAMSLAKIAVEGHNKISDHSINQSINQQIMHYYFTVLIPSLYTGCLIDDVICHNGHIIAIATILIECQKADRTLNQSNPNIPSIYKVPEDIEQRVLELLIEITARNYWAIKQTGNQATSQSTRQSTIMRQALSLLMTAVAGFGCSLMNQSVTQQDGQYILESIDQPVESSITQPTNQSNDILKVGSTVLDVCLRLCEENIQSINQSVLVGGVQSINQFWQRPEFSTNIAQSTSQVVEHLMSLSIHPLQLSYIEKWKRSISQATNQTSRGAALALSTLPIDVLLNKTTHTSLNLSMYETIIPSINQLIQQSNDQSNTSTVIIHEPLNSIIVTLIQSIISFNQSSKPSKKRIIAQGTTQPVGQSDVETRKNSVISLIEIAKKLPLDRLNDYLLIDVSISHAIKQNINQSTSAEINSFNNPYYKRSEHPAADQAAQQSTVRLIDCLIEVLLIGLLDYSIDNRGDIGSWVRETCMDGLIDLWTIKLSANQSSSWSSIDKYVDESKSQVIYHLSSHDQPTARSTMSSVNQSSTQSIIKSLNQSIDQSLLIRSINGVLKQLMEKIDRTREVAGNTIVALLSINQVGKQSSNQLLKIPHEELLLSLIPLNQPIIRTNQSINQSGNQLFDDLMKQSNDLSTDSSVETPVDQLTGQQPTDDSLDKSIDWSSPRQTFPMLVPLINQSIYRTSILSGIFVSVGGLSESTIQSSSLIDCLLDCSIDCLIDCLIESLTIFDRFQGQNRVTLPMFKTLDLLCQNGIFARLNQPSDQTRDITVIFNQLVDRIWNEINRSINMRKLTAASSLLINFSTINHSVNQSTQPLIVCLLMHPYPMIRKMTAEYFYTQCLLQDGEKYVDWLFDPSFDQSADASENDWSDQYEDLCAILSETQWDAEQVSHSTNQSIEYLIKSKQIARLVNQSIDRLPKWKIADRSTKQSMNSQSNDDSYASFIQAER